MERVTGIGGFFFRARDPKALARTHDPEGNPIELWEAGGTDARRPVAS